jgi:hypothetical protein
MSRPTIRSLVIAIVFVAIALPTVAFAHDEATTSPSSSTTVSNHAKAEETAKQLNQKIEAQKQELQAKAETAKADLRQRLDDAKRKICDNHKTQINRVMDNMDKRRQNAFDRITQVATSVEDFYVKKQLTIANYADLVAKIDATKAVAQTAMTTQQSVPQLDCSGEHPRADVADFKEKRAGSITAMQAYRDAVKTLVSAVKTAAQTAKDAA